ncbi:MAG: Zn-ribbon containing protein [Candidatus Norongarragalinales archaeon]
MPHKCVRCGRVLADKSPELFKGCSCGSRVFVFLRDDQVTLAELEASGITPSNEQKEKAASEAIDARELAWLEEELSPLAVEKPVSIDYDAAENLRVLEEGSYEVNVSSLMRGDPLVVKSEKGIYYIRLPEFKKHQETARRKKRGGHA